MVGCVHFAVSDANRGSPGGREGHLGATVVVEFARAGTAYHSTVRVPSSVCVSVPETPDVALWEHGQNKVVISFCNQIPC